MYVVVVGVVIVGVIAGFSLQAKLMWLIFIYEQRTTNNVLCRTLYVYCCVTRETVCQ